MFHVCKVFLCGFQQILVDKYGLCSLEFSTACLFSNAFDGYCHRVLHTACNSHSHVSEDVSVLCSEVAKHIEVTDRRPLLHRRGRDLTCDVLCESLPRGILFRISLGFKVCFLEGLVDYDLGIELHILDHLLHRSLDHVEAVAGSQGLQNAHCLDRLTCVRSHQLVVAQDVKPCLGVTCLGGVVEKQSTSSGKLCADLSSADSRLPFASCGFPALLHDISICLINRFAVGNRNVRQPSSSRFLIQQIRQIVRRCLGSLNGSCGLGDLVLASGGLRKAVITNGMLSLRNRSVFLLKLLDGLVGVVRRSLQGTQSVGVSTRRNGCDVFLVINVSVYGRRRRSLHGCNGGCVILLFGRSYR